MNKVSVIITTIKPKITTLKYVPENYEVIISKTKGLGKARNEGAKRASGDILVFLDDDLEINPKLYEYIKVLKAGTFAIAFETEPSTRALMVWKKDFDRIKGFDESLTLSGEDRDFTVNAIRNGLKPFWLSRRLYTHVTHPLRAQRSRLDSLKMMWQQASVMRKHGAYSRCYISFSQWFLYGLIYYKKLEQPPKLRYFVSYSFWGFIRLLCLAVKLFT